MLRRYTKQEDDFLSDNYLSMTDAEMAKKLDRSVSSIKNRKHFLNLKLPPEILKERRLKTAFKKGHVPFNKGKKLEDFMTPKNVAKFRKNTFKKGRKPHNTKYNGHERLTKDGYVMIRVEEGRYVLKHRKLWEEHFGKLQPGQNVVFKNNDRTDIRIENLELKTDAELLAENRGEYLEFPEELRTSIRLRNKLKKK